MPEYPEVSTVRKILNVKLENKVIKDIEIIYAKILKNIDSNSFKNQLKGEKIVSVDNYGKYLIIKFVKFDLVIHLRMEGKLFYYETEHEIKKHDHIIFYFEDGSQLVYEDIRKFGTFDLYEKDAYMNSKQINKLGKEPLDSELTVKYLKNKLENNRKIKESLLDQTIINGLGNIYVDEILFASQIHPKSISKNLEDEQIESIILNTRLIIKQALENNGTTIKSFAASDQIKGNYQKYLKVYKRKDQPCFICETPIEKIKIGGRGTHFCPFCQKIYDNSN